MSVTWNKKMRKTAGYCVTGQEKGGGSRYARIELSEKVCDSAGDAAQRIMQCSITILCFNLLHFHCFHLFIVSPVLNDFDLFLLKFEF